MQFTLDADLQRLAYWLRAAGYNSRLIDATAQNKNKIPAFYQIRQAKQQQRFLVTTNSSYLGYRGKHKHLIIIEGVTLEQQIASLSHSIQLNWLHAPLSLCIHCGMPLKQEPQEEATYCVHCQSLSTDEQESKKIYSQLSHWNAK